jgi:hypothetical protein
MDFRRKRRQSNSSPCLSKRKLLGSLFAQVACFLYLLSVKNEITNQFIRKKKSWSDNERCSILTRLNDNEISNLKEIDLKNCDLQSIPSSIQYATGLVKLDVSNNPLTTLPKELKYCTNLDILFASSCPLIATLPQVLGDMPSITRLGWRSGSLSFIDPENLPPNLVHLILTDNKIQSLSDPQIFHKMKNVRKLMLSHNQLESFGSNGGLEQMRSLELLRLAGNKLNQIPSQLWTLPRLTWLTISGNPVTDAFATQAKAKKIPSIKMDDLEPTGKYLGEGASGKVELYNWQGKEVAVKLIHGVTSDGKAEDELAIYSLVGSSGLGKRVVGCVAILDDERKGVVMEPLPAKLDDFALPPTIIEVTADRWDSKLIFQASFVKNALHDAATALNFLHGIGISHGDFYAHNIKVDRTSGRLFLLDFGASFIKGLYASQAEKLEVRAFGILVEELSKLLDPMEINLKEKLLSLHRDCTNGNVDSRPSFDSILSILED